MNQFVIIIPFFLISFVLSLLNLFRLTSSWILYLIPKQAFLDLLWASFHTVPAGPIIFAVIYLPIWLGLAYFIAFRAFDKMVYGKDARAFRPGSHGFPCKLFDYHCVCFQQDYWDNLDEGSGLFVYDTCTDLYFWGRLGIHHLNTVIL
jgi:hypothetical protein